MPAGLPFTQRFAEPVSFFSTVTGVTQSHICNCNYHLGLVCLSPARAARETGHILETNERIKLPFLVGWLS